MIFSDFEKYGNAHCGLAHALCILCVADTHCITVIYKGSPTDVAGPKRQSTRSHMLERTLASARSVRRCRKRLHRYWATQWLRRKQISVIPWRPLRKHVQEIRRPLWGHRVCGIVCCLLAPPVVLPCAPPGVSLSLLVKTCAPHPHPHPVGKGAAAFWISLKS